MKRAFKAGDIVVFRSDQPVGSKDYCNYTVQVLEDAKSGLITFRGIIVSVETPTTYTSEKVVGYITDKFSKSCFVLEMDPLAQFNVAVNKLEKKYEKQSV